MKGKNWKKGKKKSMPMDEEPIKRTSSKKPNPKKTKYKHPSHWMDEDDFIDYRSQEEE